MMRLADIQSYVLQEAMSRTWSELAPHTPTQIASNGQSLFFVLVSLIRDDNRLYLPRGSSEDINHGRIS